MYTVSTHFDAFCAPNVSYSRWRPHTRAHTYTHPHTRPLRHTPKQNTHGRQVVVSGRRCFLLSSRLRKQPPLFLAQIQPHRSPAVAYGRCLRTPSGAVRRRLYRSCVSSGYSRPCNATGHVTSGALYEAHRSTKEARSNTAAAIISWGHPAGRVAEAADPGLGVVDGSCLP